MPARKGSHNDPSNLRGLEPYIGATVVEPETNRQVGGEPQSSTAIALAKLGVRSLADILKDPRALEPPKPVVPRLAWVGRVTLLAAPEKCGKSTLATAAAAAVTRGTEFLGAQCSAGAVLWASFDREHVSDLACRMVRFGVHADRLFLFEIRDEPLEALERAAKVLRPAALVVDPLSKLGEALGLTDASSSAAWSPIMTALTGIARETDTAEVLLHHARRSDGAYRDSSAIGAGVDVILEMAADTKEDTVRHIKGKGRFTIPSTSVRLSGNAYELLDASLPLAERVIDYVQHNPGCTIRALREAVTGKAEEIGATVDSLVAEGRLENRGTGTARALHAAEPGAALGTTASASAVPT